MSFEKFEDYYNMYKNASNNCKEKMASPMIVSRHAFHLKRAKYLDI